MQPIPFKKCPKCGHDSNIKELPSLKAFFHYLCQSCGYEEAGTVSYAFPPPGFEIDTSEAEVIIKWAGHTASARELLALRKISEELRTLSSVALKRRISFRPKWNLGIFTSSVAKELAKQAESLGLLVEINEVKKPGS